MSETLEQFPQKVSLGIFLLAGLSCFMFFSFYYVFPLGVLISLFSPIPLIYIYLVHGKRAGVSVIAGLTVFLVFVFQYLSAGNHLTLTGGQSTDLASPGTGPKIGFRFLSGNLADRSRDADLSFQLAPVKNQRCAWILGKFYTLAAFIVGIKDKTPFIKVLEQNHPAGKPALSGCCGQAYSFRKNRLSLHGRLKPLLKLFQRIGIHVLPGKARGLRLHWKSLL